MKRILLFAVGVLVVLFVLIQLIPVQRDNPAVTREVQWDAPETRALAQRACFDCHSNETVWPWYARIAPMSLILDNHVHEGREKLNFSQWDQPNEEFEEVDETLREGGMPPWDYLIMHAEAKLTADENSRLLNGLRATYQQDPPVAGEGGEEEGERDDD